MEIESTLLHELSEIVYKESGIIFKDSNLTVLESRLSSRLAKKKISASEYLALLRKNPAELRDFLDFVTTNYTSFFRYPRHFEMLEHRILPQLVQKNSQKHLLFWSAGCSTGEEPYSIAITVDTFLKKNHLFDWTYEVIGSDISLQSLFSAREGIFPQKALDKVSENIVHSYFLPQGNGYQVHPDIVKHVRFDYHNLIYDNGIRDIPVVFCRNVLIYFDLAVQLKVLENIHRSMQEGGFLFIGHSESLIGITELFRAQSLPEGIVYVRQ